MNTLFTERFEEYLKRNGYYNADGTLIPSVPEDCRKLFEHFPNFVIDETLSINFYDMFIQDNSFKEIGAETEELFTYYLRRTIDEALIEYIPKINIFIKNFNNDLMSRKVQLQSNGKNTYNLTFTDERTGSNVDSDYLNPANSNASILQGKTATDIQNDSTQKQTGDTSVTGSREQAYSWFKSNPQVLNEIMELKNIYLQALRHFDKLFMYVL